MRKTWIETLEQLVANKVFPNTVHRLLLWGPFGTGKSTKPHKLFKHVESVTLRAGYQGAHELIGETGLDSGNSTFKMGPATKAMLDGAILKIDELDRASADVMGCLYQVLDDPELIRIPVHGGIVSPAPGYGVVATTNQNPESLDPGIVDRFDIVLRADTPAALPIRKHAMEYLCNHYSSNVVPNLPTYRPKISSRRILTAERIGAATGNYEEAYSLVFAGLAPELLTALATIEGGK